MEVEPLPQPKPPRSRSPEFIHAAARWALAGFMLVTAIGGGFFYVRLLEIVDNQAEAARRGRRLIAEAEVQEALLLRTIAVGCRVLVDDPTVADICTDPDVVELLADQ